jgi:hypothetical protein
MRSGDGLRLFLAATLAGCLVLLLALVYPATVPHEFHHLHHGAATHGTVICSWLCAAGQGVEGNAVPAVYRLDPVDLLELLVALNSDEPSLFSVSSRAPPTI